MHPHPILHSMQQDILSLYVQTCTRHSTLISPALFEKNIRNGYSAIPQYCGYYYYNALYRVLFKTICPSVSTNTTKLKLFSREEGLIDMWTNVAPYLDASAGRAGFTTSLIQQLGTTVFFWQWLRSPPGISDFCWTDTFVNIADCSTSSIHFDQPHNHWSNALQCQIRISQFHNGRKAIGSLGPHLIGSKNL